MEAEFKNELQLYDEKNRSSIEGSQAAKMDDWPSVKHNTDICTFSNSQSVHKFMDVDEDGDETAFKDVVRLFREPNSRRFLPKYGYLRIQIAEFTLKPDGTEDEEYFDYGEPVEIDLSKYVALFDEPFTSIFKPTASQLASKPDLPLAVKVDAEVTVRPSKSEVTTSKSNKLKMTP